MHITIETNVTTPIYGNLRFTTAKYYIKIIAFHSSIKERRRVAQSCVLNEGCDSYILGYI